MATNIRKREQYFTQLEVQKVIILAKSGKGSLSVTEIQVGHQ